MLDAPHSLNSVERVDFYYPCVESFVNYGFQDFQGKLGYSPCIRLKVGVSGWAPS